ncbi:MAG: hypothetical protein ACRDHF_13360 [Tepidiformaceae bacterium]
MHRAPRAFERPEDLAESGNPLDLLTERQFIAFAAYAAKRDMGRVARALKISRRALYYLLRRAQAAVGPPPLRRGRAR